MIKYLSRLVALFLVLPGFALIAQPADFAFPAGCVQASPLGGEGTLFRVSARIDGVNAQQGGGDYIAVFNGNGDVIGVSALSVGFGANPSIANLYLRTNAGGNNCPTYNEAPSLTVKLYDATADGILIAPNSFFQASVFGGEIVGPDGDASLRDLFDFLAASLPVALAEFTATANDGAVKLDWSTATESNNSYFEIQRSADPATGFEKIGVVDGNETTTSTSNYDFTDLNPGEGTVYYRLNQVDVTGTSAYSPIVVVELEVSANREVAVFPNPTASGSRLTVQLNGPWTNGGADIQLLDAAGRKVADWNGLSNGSLNTALPVLRSGVYQLVVTDGGERRITRVVVR
ncbi:T9SS type A sorting domain-containing protein [Neolewinella persica]|uniref:T9SS type A sorting domain-containing protein n=1 Tax=Neolewinella persica TaxID=70998 RepID=UPI0006934B26|nr:T9SS type A sorting domain-containing protein [Neolewinella persica]